MLTSNKLVYRVVYRYLYIERVHNDLRIASKKPGVRMFEEVREEISSILQQYVNLNVNDFFIPNIDPRIEE